jgi:hypothetical protein
MGVVYWKWMWLTEIGNGLLGMDVGPGICIAYWEWAWLTENLHSLL